MNESIETSGYEKDSLEESWFHLEVTRYLHNDSEFNNVMFERVLGDTKLDILKKIKCSYSQRRYTNLLIEWSNEAKYTDRWILKTVKAQSNNLNDEDFWHALKVIISRDIWSDQHPKVKLLLDLLEIKKHIWVNNAYRSNFLFKAAMHKNSMDMMSFLLDKTAIDINSKLNISDVEDMSMMERGMVNHLKRHPISLGGNDSIKKILIDMGADLFSEYGGCRPWNQLIDSQSSVGLARALAIETLLPKKDVAAEDIWIALDASSTVQEKVDMLNRGNKNGIWELRSVVESKKGATTLMYLADMGHLNSETIAKMVPANAWNDTDDLGRNYIDYLYEGWINSGGNNNINVRNIPKDQIKKITPEKYASLVWSTMNKKIEDTNIDNIFLVSHPQIFKIEEPQYRDRFWKSFFSNEHAQDRLFKAIISNGNGALISGSSTTKKYQVPFCLYKNDFSVWRKSLQEARMDDGKRWIESSKKIADAAIMLFLIEKITENYRKNWGQSWHRFREVEIWSDGASEILTDLYGVGADINSALMEKNKLCAEYEKEIEKIEIRERSRISRLEDFDDAVLDQTQGIGELLDEWTVFGERIRLSSVIQNTPCKSRESVCQNAL